MLNEPASSSLEQPIHRRDDYVTDTNPVDTLHIELRDLVEQVMHVNTMVQDTPDPQEIGLFNPLSDYEITFVGKLKGSAEAAYDKLDDLLKPKNMLPVFRPNEEGDGTSNPHTVHILRGRVRPVEGRWWINLILAVLTLFSVLFVGAQMAIGAIYAEDPARAEAMMQSTGTFLAEIWRGYPYAISLSLIWGAHELGHYFAARAHKHSVSLPYFIPLPFGIVGTMGAFIRLREPMRNRKVLMDMGAAGPLAGMVFAVPILFIGLATSPINLIQPGGLLEGNSVFYALAKIITFGQFLPNGMQDVYVNQLAWAGWVGLLVTGLNLLPVGQLDGGHVLYSLLGERAKLAYYPVIGTMIVLALISQVWVLWVLLLLLLGRVHATPLDTITPLDNRRRYVAIFTLILFIFIFVPIPLSENNAVGETVPENTVQTIEQPTALALE